MGHSKVEKAKTHQRIVALASKRFREKGLAGIGIADLMKEAGLTVGGFYKHFSSRDDLVAEAISSALGDWQRKADAAASGGPPLTFDSLIDDYFERNTSRPSRHRLPSRRFGRRLRTKRQANSRTRHSGGSGEHSLARDFASRREREEQRYRKIASNDDVLRARRRHRRGSRSIRRAPFARNPEDRSTAFEKPRS